MANRLPAVSLVALCLSNGVEQSCYCLVDVAGLSEMFWPAMVPLLQIFLPHILQNVSELRLHLLKQRGTIAGKFQTESPFLSTEHDPLASSAETLWRMNAEHRASLRNLRWMPWTSHGQTKSSASWQREKGTLLRVPALDVLTW